MTAKGAGIDARCPPPRFTCSPVHLLTTRDSLRDVDRDVGIGPAAVELVRAALARGVDRLQAEQVGPRRAEGGGGRRLGLPREDVHLALREGHVARARVLRPLDPPLAPRPVAAVV